MNHIYSVERVVRNWLFSKRPGSIVAYSIAAMLFLLFGVFLLYPADRAVLQGKAPLVVYAHEGVVLRQFREKDTGAFRENLSLDEYPSTLVELTLQSEDRRFYYHPGIDLIAVGRATIQNLQAARIVSGASTIPMQLARIVYSHRMPDSHYLRKPLEALYALRLSTQFSKSEILEAYFNRVPLPANSAGFREAASRIFHRDVRYLTEEQSAALVVLLRGRPAGPEKLALGMEKLLLKSRNENKNPGKRIREVADRMIRSAEDSQAENHQNFFAKNRDRFAPHFVDYIRASHPDLNGAFYSSISSELTSTISSIIHTELGVIEKYNAGNAAVVVMEYNEEDQTLLLRSLVGSRDYNQKEEGQVNGALAIRSAGSTLKPFVYAMAMDKQRNPYKPYSIVKDEEFAVSATADGETYRPLNYDLNYWGDMTLRQALATSRNLPPVGLVDELGVDRFYRLMETLGAGNLQEGPETYGPGIALGTAGISLLELARAYSVFVSEGELLPVHLGRSLIGQEVSAGEQHRIFSARTAFWITDILSDRSVRRRAFGKRSFLDFPFPVAAKTGTSKDFRDSWTVAYTRRFIVAVWVGNFDNDAMKDVSGVYGAGRIMQQVIRFLHPDGSSGFVPPAGYRAVPICTKTGQLATEDCPSHKEWISPDMRPPPRCSGHGRGITGAYMDEPVEPLQIASPAPGETFLLDPHTPTSAQAIPVHILQCPRDYRIYINGRLLKSAEHRKQVSSSAQHGPPGGHPPEKMDIRIPVSLPVGSHTIRVEYPGGSEQVDFRVQ